MSVELYDAGMRAAAAHYRRPVPRLRATPLPDTAVRLAVRTVRAKRGPVALEVAGPGQTAQRATGRAALGLLGRTVVALCGGDLLGDDAPVVCAVTAGFGTVEALGALGALTPAEGDADEWIGAAVAGCWYERAAHPGTGLVVNLRAASAVKFLLGVVPGEESDALWRARLGVNTAGVEGLHHWWDRLDGAERLRGLESVRSDDRWLWRRMLGDAVEGKSPRRETLALAALRLRTRCDAADLWEAALLGDPWWRRRAVHSGHVCTGTVSVGTGKDAARFTVHSDRSDTRLKVGAAVLGWTGTVTADHTGNQFHGEVIAVGPDPLGGLALTVAVRRRGRRPAADERVSLMSAPPSASVQFAGRAAMRSRYRTLAGWIGRTSIPDPQRREVPLAVMIAAADPDEQETN